MHWIMQGQSVLFWRRTNSSQNNKQTDSKCAVSHDPSPKMHIAESHWGYQKEMHNVF